MDYNLQSKIRINESILTQTNNWINTLIRENVIQTIVENYGNRKVPLLNTTVIVSVAN